MRWYWSSRLAGWLLLVLICFGVILIALGLAGLLPGQTPIAPKPTPVNIQLPTL